MNALVLSASVSLHLLAAAWALRLPRLTGRSAAWVCLGAAIGLLGVPPTLALARLLLGNDPVGVAPEAEAFGLLVAVLMAFGVGSIGPLVKRLRRTDEVAQLTGQLRQEADRRRQVEETLRREQQTLAHLKQASDDDRRLIGYEIHDGLAQQLAAALMHSQTYDTLRREAPEQAEDAYRAVVESLRQAHAEARRLIGAIRSTGLDHSGIEAALAGVIRAAGGPDGPSIEFQSDVGCKRLPEALENAVYRIAQQALTNACRHSRTKRIKVSLVQEDGSLLLEVRDWGIGFDWQAVPDDRFGLEGIRERVRMLGGELTVESAPGKGTCVRVTFPIGVIEA